MFGWFRSKATSPVESAERAWLEGRTRWLISEFGLDKARTTKMILPTPEFFPDAYDASHEAGRVLFGRTCRYAGINPDGLELHFFQTRNPFATGDFTQSEGAAGLYEGGRFATRIQIDEASLADPLMMVATASHELAHVLLLGQGRLTGNEPDHEEITDLLTIYLGFGIFTANSRVRDRSTHVGTSEHWSINRLGYLRQPQVGYALALWARLRGEDALPWSAHLCADVRAYFKQAVKWLAQNGDSVLDPQTGSPAPLSDDETWLAHKGESAPNPQTDSPTLLSDDEAPPGFEKRR
jgi:hypothetical protein